MMLKFRMLVLASGTEGFAGQDEEQTLALLQSQTSAVAHGSKAVSLYIPHTFEVTVNWGSKWCKISSVNRNMSSGLLHFEYHDTFDFSTL